MKTVILVVIILVLFMIFNFNVHLEAYDNISLDGVSQNDINKLIDVRGNNAYKGVGLFATIYNKKPQEQNMACGKATNDSEFIYMRGNNAQLCDTEKLEQVVDIRGGNTDAKMNPQLGLGNDDVATRIKNVFYNFV